VVNHSDGYAGNTNNFYLYFDPDDGDRGVFIPWGPDASLDARERVKTTSELTRRLSRVPELRQRYLDRLQWVLDEVWDEERLQARFDSFLAQAGSAEADVPDQADTVEELREWIGLRRSEMEAFIADGGEIGEDEPGLCIGNFIAEEFLLPAEWVTASSAACSASPGARGWATGLAVALLAPAIRRHRAPRNSENR
jgi:hypothetical protein